MDHLNSEDFYYVRDLIFPGVKGFEGVFGKWKIMSGEDINKRIWNMIELKGPIPRPEFFSPLMDDEDVIEREKQKLFTQMKQWIADAIVRPKNVIPDSCSEFIGWDDLALAEERAVLNNQRKIETEKARKKEIERERLLGPKNHPELFPDF